MSWQFSSDPASGRTVLLVWSGEMCAFRFDVPKPIDVTECDFSLETPLDSLKQQLGIERHHRYFGNMLYLSLELLRRYVIGAEVPEFAMQGLA